MKTLYECGSIAIETTDLDEGRAQVDLRDPHGNTFTAVITPGESIEDALEECEDAFVVGHTLLNPDAWADYADDKPYRFNVTIVPWDVIEEKEPNQ